MNLFFWKKRTANASKHKSIKENAYIRVHVYSKKHGVTWNIYYNGRCINPFTSEWLHLITRENCLQFDSELTQQLKEQHLCFVEKHDRQTS